jgi:hypothetical protein
MSPEPMTEPAMAPAEEWKDFSLSLVRNDPLFRLQRRLGLIPPDGPGVGRRAVFWTLVAWLPIAIWAVLNRRAMPGTVEEPLLQHFAVHTRLLIGIPAFHLAEALAHRALQRFLPYLVQSGIVPPDSIPAYQDVLRSVARFRDRTLPWIAILGVTVVLSAFNVTAERMDELTWGMVGSGGQTLGFGGWWYVLVGRAIFLILLLSWVWRLFLFFGLFRGIAKLDLALVPTHADRVAGLSVIEYMPTVFAPVIFAISSVLAATWGHQVLYHGVHVTELRVQMIAFILLMLVLFLSPSLALAPLLTRTKKKALLDYGALIGAQGRLVRRRWIEGRDVEDMAILSAPELGPVADINALYEPIRTMRPVPVGAHTLAAVALPAVLPLIPVLAIEIPVKDLLLGLIKSMV